MKTFILIIASVTIILIGYQKHDNEKRQKLIEFIINNQKDNQSIMLDSQLIRHQVQLLEKDSVMTIYLLNQLQLNPILARRSVQNLHRHYYLDDQCMDEAMKSIARDEFIRCCL